MDWDFHCAAERADAEEEKMAKAKTAELNFMVNGRRNLNIQNNQYRVSVVKWTTASLLGVAALKLKSSLIPSQNQAADDHITYTETSIPSRPKAHNPHINNTAVGTRSKIRSPLPNPPAHQKPTSRSVP